MPPGPATEPERLEEAWCGVDRFGVCPSLTPSGVGDVMIPVAAAAAWRLR
jgi:hypothetical protein